MLAWFDVARSIGLLRTNTARSLLPKRWPIAPLLLSQRDQTDRPKKKR